MHHFRRKPSSATPTTGLPPTPIELMKKELATIHPRRTKDPRMLAASSGVIALSIGSPPCDPFDTAPNEPGSSGESGWKTAYAGARMAVEIAKESSDMFLPLKAIVGALAVLIKNHDVNLPQVAGPIDR